MVDAYKQAFRKFTEMFSIARDAVSKISSVYLKYEKTRSLNYSMDESVRWVLVINDHKGGS